VIFACVFILIIVIFENIYISQRSVATQLRCGGIFSNLLQIVQEMCQWKNYENRL